MAAWGGGHEKCDQAHNPTELTHPNCVPKNSIRDFETSFRSTIDSMNKNGFDSTKGLVPVIPVGNVFFAINGAHRIGAAIATKNLVCVEKVNLPEHNWDENFFRKKNVPNSDIIMRYWANLDKKMIAIIINPKAVVLASKMEKVRKIIADCSDTKSIIFEKNLPVDSGRMQGVLSMAYSDEKWFKNLELETYASGFLTERNPTCKIFVIHGTQEHMKNCKLRIRNVFDFKPSGDFKKSCHIGDNHAQHLRMINYVLSDNNNKRIGQVIKAYKPEYVWNIINSDTSIQSNINWLGEKTASNAIYSKTIYLNNQGVKSLVQHVFNEKNVQIHVTGDDELKPITVSFFHSNECKHDCLTHIQTIVLAQMTLNDNSIMFLNRHDGNNCKDVAYEVASRLGLKPTVGTFFQFPSDIMIDSGAVMSFFGLRQRTDIDILFQNKIDKTVLGWGNNILIEAHAFNSNKLGNGRAWGEEHISPTRSVNDLFTNPENYGYCHGIKFVSLQQLVHYKTRRGEPNKDDKDVAQIKSFLKDTPPKHFGVKNGNHNKERQLTCSWPPPLYPNKSKTPEKYMKRLTKIQQWAELNKDSVVIYLQSGSLLGMYREGGLIPGDSDIDIRYTVSNEKKQAELFELKLKFISLNALKTWGDHWNGFWYIEPEDINGDFIAEFNKKNLICKPSRSSPLQTHIHTRTEIEYSYGPTWFIRMSFRTTDIDHYIEYVNPKSWWNKDWVKMIQTINKIDSDGNRNVTVGEITEYVKNDGIDIEQYNLQISPRDRCRASRMLNWLLEYDESPYPIENRDKSAINANHPLIKFVECDDI